MKTTAAAFLALMVFGGPALALEGRAVCAANPAASELARDVEAKLPVSLLGPDQQVPDTFYVRLTCVLLANGYTGEEIVAMAPETLIDAAAIYLTQDRSRADALLAILNAMKQAKLVPAAPEPVKP